MNTLPVRIEHIPSELKNRPQWVLWKWETREGKPTKPPYQPDNTKASHSDPETWRSFDAILQAFEKAHSRWDGVGFMLSPADPFAALDIDKCRDPETREVEPWAAELARRIDSYTEVSPSGTGLRILLKGALPADVATEKGGGRKKGGLGPDCHGGLEVYDKLRYVTLTGHRYGPHKEPQDRGDAFSTVCREFFPASAPEAPRPHREPSGASLDLSDEALLAQADLFPWVDKLRALMRGDKSAYMGTDGKPDDSRADSGLCTFLAWLTDRDPARIDRIFRTSGLYRAKWERAGYREETIRRACALVSEGFDPSQAPRPVFRQAGKVMAPVDEGLTLEKAAELALAACAQAKQDEGVLFKPENLQAFALVKRWDPQNWARVRGLLQKRRISMREFYTHLPRVELEGEDRAALTPEHTEPAALAGDFLTDCPVPTLAVPEPYFLNERLTGKMVADKETGQPRPLTLAYAPVVITGRMRDAVTGEESLLVAWRWPGSHWVSRVVERSQALTGRKLIDLSAVGFPVGDDSAKSLVGYLHRVEAANRQALPCAAVSSHLGWQGNPDTASFLCGRLLVLPDGTREIATALDVDHPEAWSEQRVSFHGVGAGEEQIVDAFHSGGSIEEWKSAVSLLEPYPKALIAFYASFCPPLLAVFGVPNFIVDLANRTSTGKTTALRAAASVWGNPDERTAASVVGTWDATRVWTERASHVLSGLPLIMDDTKKARNVRAVADLVYAVASGRGRGRGNVHGIAQTAHWRTVMLSSGEQPATSYTQDGGTRTRVLSIRGTPFGEADYETGRIVSKLNAGLCQHYGHAGPEFIAWLMRDRQNWDEWRDQYTQWVEFYSSAPPTPEAGRLAQYAALVTVAGEMAHEALGLPWEHTNPLKALWEELAAEAADAAGDIRALEDVMSWAGSHEHSFYGRHPHDDEGNCLYRGAVSGKWQDGEFWDEIAFYPNVLKDILREEGYEPDSILSGWRERGWLRHIPKKYTVDVKVGGETRKLVVLKRAALEVLSGGEDE